MVVIDDEAADARQSAPTKFSDGIASGGRHRSRSACRDSQDATLDPKRVSDPA
jgi:hypothetical protein